jgi:pilus assembly protein CpaB
MNRTRLLMIGVLALALGFLVSVYVYKSLQSKSGVPSDPGIDVIVAADDLQVGARVEEHDIKIIRIPVADLPSGAPRRRSDVLGHGVIIPITKGEFILPTKLAGENAGSGLPSLIPPGMRAFSVRVNEVVSVAGFVTAGTRVDVLLTGTPNGGSEPQTTTVLQNVAVLAAGSKLERNQNGEPVNTPVITLLVSPDDAQRLALATSEGKIQLALRNPLDTKSDEVSFSGARGLYKYGPSPNPAPKVQAPVHHPLPVKATPTPPPASTGVSVEVYQGDKPKQVVPFSDQNSEAK